MGSWMEVGVAAVCKGSLSAGRRPSTTALSWHSLVWS